MTGKAGIQNATNKEDVEESENDIKVIQKPHPPPTVKKSPHSPFLNKLDTLTKKIHLY
jgi:hypothetical protein